LPPLAVAPSATHTTLSTPTSRQRPPTVQQQRPSIATPSLDGTPSSPPTLIYVEDNEIAELSQEGASRTLAVVPEAGNTESALLHGDRVLLLREQGLQLVDLVEDAAVRLMPFDAPVLFGNLMPAGADAVLYSAMLDDGGGGTMGFTAHVGLYSSSAGRERQLIEHEGSLVLLGENAAGDSTYLLPLGGDPEFSEVWLVSLATGEVRTRLPVEGYEFAALSPDARLLATAGIRFLPEGQRLDYGLGLYDLRNDESVDGRWLPLPLPDSHVSGLIWSGDGQCLYFHLRPGSPQENPTETYGLWCLNPERMEYSRVSPLDEPTAHIVTISPDDGWLVLRPETAHEIIMVDLAAGGAVTLSLPDNFEEIVRWR
jgi:hypothetical protein